MRYLLLALFLTPIFLPFTANAEESGGYYQYQCIPELNLITISELGADTWSGPREELLQKYGIFSSYDLVEFKEDVMPNDQSRQSDCCFFPKPEPLTFKCDLKNQMNEPVTYEISVRGLPLNTNPVAMCGGATSITVSIHADNKQLVDDFAFVPYKECFANERSVSALKFYTRQNRFFLSGDKGTILFLTDNTSLTDKLFREHLSQQK